MQINVMDALGQKACCGTKEYDPNKEGCCEKSETESQIYNLSTECCTKHKRVISLSIKPTSQVCIRPLNNPWTGWTNLVVHCFLDVPYYGAWGFFDENIGIAPEPAAAGTVVWGFVTRKSQCKRIKCDGCVDDKELALTISDYRNGSGYAASTYKLRSHNCCHWVNDVLKTAGCNGVESYFSGYSLPSTPSPVAP